MHYLGKTVSLYPASFCTPRPNSVTLGICIPVPYDEKNFFFFGVSSRRSCRSSKNHSPSASLALEPHQWRQCWHARTELWPHGGRRAALSTPTVSTPYTAVSLTRHSLEISGQQEDSWNRWPSWEDTWPEIKKMERSQPHRRHKWGLSRQVKPRLKSSEELQCRRRPEVQDEVGLVNWDTNSLIFCDNEQEALKQQSDSLDLLLHAH